MKSLRQTFRRSHKISVSFSIIAIILSITLAISIFLYSSEVLNHRIPNSIVAQQLIVAVNDSISLQKSWILMGDNKTRQQRKQIWLKEIPSLIFEIEKRSEEVDGGYFLTDDEERYNFKKSILQIKLLLNRLKDSQWWVEDISSSKGSSPSRIIYDRDILPLFANLNSALEGLMYDENYNAIESHELRINLLSAHHHLSDGLRELSEAVRTGSLPHINSFYRETKLLDEQLQRFLNLADQQGSSQNLLNWVIRNYQEYLRLADKSIQNRKAIDSNLGLRLYTDEALPLSNELNFLLQELIETENSLLISGAERVNDNLLIFLILISIIFCTASFLSLNLTNKSAKHYDKSIDALKLASQEMIEGRLIPIGTRSDFEEIQELISVFSEMQSAVIDRELKLSAKQRELNQLTHIVTHDMKPPIINITGHTRIIETSFNNFKWNDETTEIQELENMRSGVNEALDYINHSTKHIAELVGRVLTYAEWSSLRLEIKPCNLLDLVNNILAINHHRLKDSIVNLQKNMPTIHCDRFALKTIISTLIDNAIQYAHPERELILSIDYRSTQKYHQISIADNGIGIEDDDSDSVYLLSGKFSSETKPQSSNFGIGLAGVRKLLERSGGKIWHESTPSKGTCFFIDFPIISDIKS
jgi:signal transduction histidine kinase